MSRAWTGTMSSVMSPSRLESSAGSVKPVLSRSNQAGPRDGGEDEQDDRERRGHRQHAAVPARDVEGHPQVDEDVGDLHELGSLQGIPAPDRHDEDERRGHEQEQDDDRPARLARGLLAVGTLDADVILGHAGRTIQSGAGRVRRFARASGRGETGRHAGFRCRWRKPWGFESLRPHSRAASVIRSDVWVRPIGAPCLGLRPVEPKGSAFRAAVGDCIPARCA